MSYVAITTGKEMAQFPVRICSWEDIAFSEAEQLLELCSNTEQLQSYLAGRLVGGDTGKGGGKQALIELDLYTYAVLFCKKNEFSPEQLSAFFTILKSVHSLCISTPYDNLQDTFVYFRELILRHCVQRPPFSTSLYSLSQVKIITDYVLSTYFKHFKLYKYAFTKRVQLNLSIQYSGEPAVAEGGEVEGEREEKEREKEEGEEEEEEKVEEEEMKAAAAEKETEDVGETHGGGEELSPDQQRLRQIITSALNPHMKQLKVSVEQQLSEHEKRVSEKISQLETSSEQNSKKK